VSFAEAVVAEVVAVEPPVVAEAAAVPRQPW